jgi:hypothetical protein
MSWALPIEGIDHLNWVIDKGEHIHWKMLCFGKALTPELVRGRKSTSGLAPHTNANELGFAH